MCYVNVNKPKPKPYKIPITTMCHDVILRDAILVFYVALQVLTYIFG